MYQRWELLADVKILDLSRIYTGPFCSQILGDLGAEIVKVEPPQGDDTRYWGPPFINKEMSSYFAALNRNKASIKLNLKNPDDYDILIELVRWADVVLENFRPGVVEKLNIDHHTLHNINPQLIYLSITGYGSSGPFKDHASYDIIAQSESGIMSITGSNNGDIAKVGVPVGDIAAGMYGAIGILSALYHREKTGKGEYIETSLMGALTSWLTSQSLNTYFQPNKLPKPLGTAHPNIVPYQSFVSKDGKWISLAIGNDKAWKIFTSHVNDKRLFDQKFSANSGRVTNRDDLIPILTELFLQKSADTWCKELQELQIAIGRVNTIPEVHSHDQIRYLQQIKELSVDQISFPIFTTPLFFENSTGRDYTNPPPLDGHRADILQLISKMKYS